MWGKQNCIRYVAVGPSKSVCPAPPGRCKLAVKASESQPSCLFHRLADKSSNSKQAVGAECCDRPEGPVHLPAQAEFQPPHNTLAMSRQRTSAVEGSTQHSGGWELRHIALQQEVEAMTDLLFEVPMSKARDAWGTGARQGKGPAAA